MKQWSHDFYSSRGLWISLAVTSGVRSTSYQQMKWHNAGANPAGSSINRGGGLKQWETLRKTSTVLASENWLFWTKLERRRTRQRIRKHIPVFSRVEPPPVGRVKGPDAPLRAGRWRDCFQSLMKGGCWRLSPVTLVIDMLSRRPLALFGVNRRDGPKAGWWDSWQTAFFSEAEQLEGFRF